MAGDVLGRRTRSFDSVLRTPLRMTVCGGCAPLRMTGGRVVAVGSVGFFNVWILEPCGGAGGEALFYGSHHDYIVI